MQHWEQVVPGRVHAIHYEQMVGEQESAPRRLRQKSHFFVLVFDKRNVSREGV